MSNIDLNTVFKPYVKQNAALSSVQDVIMQAAIDAAEASIAEALQRKIVAVPADAATARTYQIRNDGLIRIDDAATVTSVSVNGVAIDPSLYQLEPIENRGSSGQWRPYSQVRHFYGYWPYSRWGIASVLGTWGWSPVPPQYIEAGKILAKDILSNRDVTFGIAAFTEYAAIRARSNPQVWDLIASLRSVESFGIA